MCYTEHRYFTSDDSDVSLFEERKPFGNRGNIERDDKKEPNGFGRNREYNRGQDENSRSGFGNREQISAGGFGSIQNSERKFGDCGGGFGNRGRNSEAEFEKLVFSG